MTEFALVFAGDENYARGIAVALRSALAHLAPTVSPEVYVLDNGLSEVSRVRLLKIADASTRSASLRWITIPAERLAHLAGSGHLTPATYSRLLVPELVAPSIRRVVYLDADVLVRRDLAPLFTIDLDDALVGAVRDFVIATTRHAMSGVRDPGAPRPYFNTGVLVMDVARWRSAGLTDRALDYAAAGSEPLRFADQDALNAVVDRWHELDVRWNVQHTPLFLPMPPAASALAGQLYGRRRDLLRTAAVLHFIGPKPWHRFCPTPGTTAWVRTLIRAGWYPRDEALAWVLRYIRNRAWYWLGTKKRQWRARSGVRARRPTQGGVRGSPRASWARRTTRIPPP